MSAAIPERFETGLNDSKRSGEGRKARDLGDDVEFMMLPSLAPLDRQLIVGVTSDWQVQVSQRQHRCQRGDRIRWRPNQIEFLRDSNRWRIAASRLQLVRLPVAVEIKPHWEQPKSSAFLTPVGISYGYPW